MIIKIQLSELKIYFFNIYQIPRNFKLHLVLSMLNLNLRKHNLNLTIAK